MSSRSRQTSVDFTKTPSIAERVFDGPGLLSLRRTVEKQMRVVEQEIAQHLNFSDALADTTSRYLHGAGGKRIRPMLVLLTSQLVGGATDRVIRSACALELIHLGSLYHDDVMDGADVRRGLASAHTVWGNNVAILTGDLLFSRASRLMASNGQRAIEVQTEMFERLVVGQMHETVGSADTDDPVEFYLSVLADKTGSLIAAAARAGVLFTSEPSPYEQPLADFGERAGVAFQLLDDVLDLSRDPDETGKVPGTDLRAGVPTMPYLLLSQATDADSAALRQKIDDGVVAIREGADVVILDEAVADLRGNSATTQTLTLAKQWAQQAVEALAPIPSGPVRDALVRFADVVVDRTS